ncbi:hypothetical protein ACR8AL_09905 [Clavibacter sepedonicus]|uniref:hypothetical protein n=1 Tax=Clavibacter TaxID=1573 RepID=UPI00059B7CCF|nr:MULTISPECIES: hypothetical protein [Clavibacter]MBD5380360.1 hypothetical protein [Clavibacter sp.]OQJ49414.1 hypothetical protein B5P19_15105 [Clavibacter sepedonicus]OQJ55027.1 hypothetical protein B5P20_13680 [Clavibacter sepedonicus]UUK64721.1 hypothetical protein LRE50_10520 [Clavibacter sepedonicus]
MTKHAHRTPWALALAATALVATALAPAVPAVADGVAVLVGGASSTTAAHDATTALAGPPSWFNGSSDCRFDPSGVNCRA